MRLCGPPNGRATRALGIIAVASFLSAVFSSPTCANPAATASPATQRSPTLNAKREAWRKALSRISAPKTGCFKAKYPRVAWVKVACNTVPSRPYPPPNSPRPSANDLHKNA